MRAFPIWKRDWFAQELLNNRRHNHTGHSLNQENNATVKMHEWSGWTSSDNVTPDMLVIIYPIIGHERAK